MNQKPSTFIKKDLNKSVGFIGLGRMGAAMAKNLLMAGLPIIAFDLQKEAVNKLIVKGASAGVNPADVAKKVEILFLCLPFTTEVETVLFGENGIVSKASSGLSIVDTSTIYCSDSSKFHRRLAEHNISYNDCPISGMPFRAENGTLTMMFGGSEEEFKKTKPYLELMGEFIVHCGKSGTGQMMKAFNNIVYDINIAGICEILPIAIKAGLKPETLERVFTSASGQSFASEYFLPRILDRQFDKDFSMDSAYKDIVNVQEIAINLKALMPVVNAMVSTYQTAIAMGYGEEPKSAMIKVYERSLGITVQRNKSSKKVINLNLYF